MSTKDDLLKKFDGPNQGTKRRIIQHLWRYPAVEHTPDEVFESIKDDCPAQKVGTVENNLSKLAKEEAIKQESHSFYQWVGPGRRRPNSRLHEVGRSMERWIYTLDLSTETLFIAFMIWIAGILSGIASLISLFAPGNSIVGLSFFQWFVVAGTLSILGSTVVMIWVPLYVLDVKLAR